MNRLEEATTEHTVLLTQLNKLRDKITVLTQIKVFDSLDISSINVNFSNDTSAVLQLEGEQDKLKAIILEILEGRMEDE